MSSLAPIRGSDDADGDVQPYADLPGDDRAGDPGRRSGSGARAGSRLPRGRVHDFDPQSSEATPTLLPWTMDCG
jgi:hypothetical protein